ncbi:MAG: hypothetical protein ACXVCY_17440 [Pseudobdellovibrionaceae bacterium]
MSAVKFLWWVLGVAFALGFADSFGDLTHKMGVAAVRAHQHDQISYSKYNQLLWGSSSQSSRLNH